MSNVLRLVALNGNKLECYGYSTYIDYDKEGFEGHQVGIILALVDKEENVVKNFLPDIENRDKIVEKILHDDDLVLIGTMKYFPEIDKDNKLYVVAYPYAVEGHTAYEPTENFCSIPSLTDEEIEKDVKYKVLAEALYAIDGSNRYVTDWFEIKGTERLTLHEIGNKLEEKLLSTMDDNNTIILYDEIGGDFPLTFLYDKENIKLDDLLVSLRMVRVERLIQLHEE